MLDPSDPLLSAYLDDEASAEERREVEARLAADPSHAMELRSLAGVRDLVSGLSRPTSPDLAPEVLRRISAAPSPARRTLDRLRRPIVWTAAAGVLLATATFLLPVRNDPAPPPLQPTVAAGEGTTVSEIAPAVVSEIASAVEPVGPPQIAVEDDALVSQTPSDSEPTRAEAGLDPVAMELWSRSEASRLFLSKEPVDSSEVAAVLESSSHRGFYRFDLPAVPEAPEEDAAVGGGGPIVFAAELDAVELATLRDRLGASFPGRFSEGDSTTALRNRSPEILRVTAFESSPVADVLIPQTKLALKASTETPATVSDDPEAPSEHEEPRDPGGDAEPSSSSAPIVVLIQLYASSAD